MGNLKGLYIGTIPYGLNADFLEGKDLEEVMSDVVDTIGYHDIIKVTLPGITSLPKTFAVTGMTADHEPIQEGYALVTPSSSMGSVWEWTSGNGTLQISGTFSGSTSTSVQITMGIPDNKVTGVAQ